MRFFIDRPIAILMIYLALLALGVYSLFHIPLELAPQEEFPQVDVVATWPGTSPEVMQTQVTSVLEEAALSVKGVRKITSTSEIGTSRLTIEFDPKINLEFANLALREALARSLPKLPYGVRPTVEPYVPEDFRVRPFLTYTISGNYPLQTLRELVKDKLENSLGAINGVAKVEVSGGSDLNVRITLDQKKLKELGLHPYMVVSAVSQVLAVYPSARVQKGNEEYLLRVATSPKNLKDIDEIIVSHQGSVPIKVKDVAKVSLEYADVYHLNRINGQPTIMLRVLKEKGKNTLKVAREVKSRLETVKKNLPRDLIFRVVDDESQEIIRNLNHLYLLAATITFLIFLMIFIIIRRLAPSLLILSSVAFSAIISFNFIYLFKISLNMLTLGALALGFGMFVDNSIVVFENILRLREYGLEPKEAARRGAREVIMPVLASTLTTIGVFFCFPFFQGRLRIYYLPLGIVMSIALTTSLLVSFSLIPALSPKLLFLRTKKEKSRPFAFFEKVLSFSLKHPIEILLIVLLICYGSYKLFKKNVVIGEFFRWYSRDRLSVYVSMPTGTRIEATDELIRKFEEKALAYPCEKTINAQVFRERGYINITFPLQVERSAHPYILKDELIRLATNFAGVSIGIYGFDPQGYTSSMSAGRYLDSYIRIYGYNLKKLQDIASDLEIRLRKNPRVGEIKSITGQYYWGDISSTEYILKIKQEALAKYNLDPNYLFYQLQSLLRGTFGVPLQAVIEGKERSIDIKFPEAENMDLARLQEALLVTPSGEHLRIKDLVSVEEKEIPGSIYRENQKFQMTVMWEFKGPYKAAENYRKAIYSTLSLPPGFSASMEYGFMMTTKEKAQLKFGLIAALVIIFMILASLYESFIQPFIIMMAVPLSLVGVFLAFVIAGYPFDSSAYIGLILLAGIVVNNAIILVDHINLTRKTSGLKLAEAVIKGTKERIRPVFMTTSTTVFGLLPLLLIQLDSGQRQIWSTLALATLGGLTTSALFIFLVIPIFYYYFSRNKS
ncbi:MAG: efflux RND transporter permease subunit [Candidatus Aminicenantes bacterium]|nr:efflux RND transporter permease subunit [Candidatus Aminicenantes bacterium]